MERKIGEIFEYNGEWYQCVEGNDCVNCVFIDYCKSHSKEERDSAIGLCVSFDRNDGMHVIFKKLETVGEPYIIGNKLIQRYKIYPTTYHINVYGWYYHNLDVKSWTIDVEIKQTKEDMEENKLNLKPFDIQKAREGKPVCTRDGRKARIICFDRRGDKFPIVALLDGCNEEHSEVAVTFTNEGLYEIGKKSSNDLMMLPEKKEGWINIYNADTTFYYVDGRVFETKDEAVQEAKEEVEKEQREKNEYIDTIRVEWEK